MQVVYKYKLSIGIVNTIVLHPDAQVLCVKAQRDDICMWVLQDTNKMYPAGSYHRSFIVVGTGNPFEVRIKEYHGTIMSQDHVFVYHVFEVV